MKQDILSVYYDLFDILGSIEVLAEALKEIEDVKMCRSAIIGHLECYRFYHVEKELLALYEDMPMQDLLRFKNKCLKVGTQMTIYDLLGDN